MTILPKESKELRFAVVGMVEGNGHPYSWSAIFNGYDRELMAQSPYPVIAQYLNLQPPETLGIAGARITHIWTDDGADAMRVARATHIPNIVERPESVIGEVDAVLIATDIGSEHVKRCRPFVEAGVPIFVDKPLVDDSADLRVFREWVEAGATILSSSAMRYAKEFGALRASTHDLGALRFATVTTPKSWERYGIHALEAIYPIVGPGFISARNTGSAGRDIVHFKHRDDIDVTVAAVADMIGAFGVLQVCGTAGHRQLAFGDTYFAFKAQLQSFVDYVRSGVLPFPFEETVELMQMVIAGIRSREDGGREVLLEEN